eukprot:3456771-Rhodomonas_salina.3
MSGTELAGAVRSGGGAWERAASPLEDHGCMLPCARYVLSGTDLVYAAMRSLCDVRLCYCTFSKRCPVLSWAMLLPLPYGLHGPCYYPLAMLLPIAYAMSGTDVAYAASRR